MNYEFTQTLHPKMYRLSASDQFRLTQPALRHAFRGLQASCVAELTSVNNVHYHGIVFLRDHKERDTFLNRLRKIDSFGRRSCSQLVNYPKWVEYINKDISTTREIIGDPIVLDELAVLCDPQYRFVDPPAGV